jgi:hypothetical protein
MIIYNLAKRLAPEHGKQWGQENEDILQEATSIFMNSDPENVSVFFEPDRVEFSDGAGSEFL